MIFALQSSTLKNRGRGAGQRAAAAVALLMVVALARVHALAVLLAPARARAKVQALALAVLGAAVAASRNPTRSANIVSAGCLQTPSIGFRLIHLTLATATPWTATAWTPTQRTQHGGPLCPTLTTRAQLSHHPAPSSAALALGLMKHSPCRLRPQAALRSSGARHPRSAWQSREASVEDEDGKRGSAGRCLLVVLPALRQAVLWSFVPGLA